MNTSFLRYKAWKSLLPVPQGLFFPSFCLLVCPLVLSSPCGSRTTTPRGNALANPGDGVSIPSLNNIIVRAPPWFRAPLSRRQMFSAGEGCLTLLKTASGLHQACLSSASHKGPAKTLRFPSVSTPSPSRPPPWLAMGAAPPLILRRRAVPELKGS